MSPEQQLRADARQLAMLLQDAATLTMIVAVGGRVDDLVAASWRQTLDSRVACLIRDGRKLERTS